MTTEERKIAEENHNLIFAFLERHHLPVEEYYDLAAIGLCYAAVAYNPNRGNFSTLAYQCMYHEICKQMTAEKRAKRGGEKPLLSCDLVYKNGDEEGKCTILSMLPSPDNVEEQCINAEMLSIFTRKLTPIQRKVFALFYRGYNQSEIAEILGYSKQYISTIRGKLAEKADRLLR